MNRRRFVSGLAAASLATTSLSLGAQLPARLRRVAIIGIGDLKGQPLASLVRGMRELGYHEGRNVEYLPPIARGGYEDLAGLASAAVKRDAEVMVTYGSTATKAAKAATRSIPIVMHVGVDPARAGLVSNLARPESNVTGIVSATRLLAGKQVEVLKDTLPHMRRLAVLWSSTSAGQAETIKLVEAAAAKLGVTVVAIEVNRSEDMKMLPAALSEARADALLPVASILLSSLRSDVVRIAAERKIPAMYASTEFVRSGGLMSYSTDQSASFYRCATYVDRLLKGVKPAELPVEQPAKFEFAINLKTAKALGIEIPKAVLFRADEVIQ